MDSIAIALGMALNINEGYMEKLWRLKQNGTTDAGQLQLLLYQGSGAFRSANQSAFQGVH